MTLDYFLYHKLNTEKNLPQEDYYIENDNIFIVADGIRHDPNEKGDYPNPSESYEIAVIACNTCLSHLQNSDRKTNAIKEAFAIATKKIVETKDDFKRKKTGGAFGNKKHRKDVKKAPKQRGKRIIGGTKDR